MGSSLQTVAWYSPQERSHGLYTILKLRAHVNWRYLSHWFGLAVVSTIAFIGDSSVDAVGSSLQTIAWHNPQKWLPGLEIIKHLKMMRLSQPAQVFGLDIHFSEWWADILMPMGSAKSLQRFCAPVISWLQYLQHCCYMYHCNSPPAPKLLKAQSIDELATSWFFRLGFSAWLPRSQSTSNCQLRCIPFSPAAVFEPVCSQSVRLQSVSTATQRQLLSSSACIMSAQLHFVSSAAIYLL